MKSFVNFLAFQAAWFAAVEGAARGWTWLGPVAVTLLVVLHVRLVPPGERLRELGFVLLAGAAGALLDSGLKALGATAYPISAGTGPGWLVPAWPDWLVPPWPDWLVPPWIITLWAAFATLPRFSLGWLRGRPLLAVLLGAVGGPLSYFAGTRLGAVAVGTSPFLTWGALVVEYAAVTPLLLALAPRDRAAAVDRAAVAAPGPPAENPQQG